MIKIDTSQIKNWEEIKKLHLEWYKEYISKNRDNF